MQEDFQFIQYTLIIRVKIIQVSGISFLSIPVVGLE